MLRTGYLSRCPWSGGLRYPLSFAVACGTLSALAGLLTGLAMHALISDAFYVTSIEAMASVLARTAPSDLAEQYRAWGQAASEVVPGFRRGLLLQSVFLFVFAPLISVAQVMILGALNHAVSRALGGSGAFEASVRVVAYAQAALLLTVVPSAGGTLSFFVGILLITFGSCHAHGLSLGRSLLVAVWWIPVLIAFGLLLFALFVMAAFGG